MNVPSASIDVQRELRRLAQDIKAIRDKLDRLTSSGPINETDIASLRSDLRKATQRPTTLDFLDIMRASGPAHAFGYVPDPGVTPGSTKFLREDATWATPSASGGADEEARLLAFFALFTGGE